MRLSIFAIQTWALKTAAATDVSQTPSRRAGGRHPSPDHRGDRQTARHDRTGAHDDQSDRRRSRRAARDRLPALHGPRVPVPGLFGALGEPESSARPGRLGPIADPDERLRHALTELYSWYEWAEPMLTNVGSRHGARTRPAPRPRQPFAIASRLLQAAAHEGPHARVRLAAPSATRLISAPGTHSSGGAACPAGRSIGHGPLWFRDRRNGSRGEAP